MARTKKRARRTSTDRIAHSHQKIAVAFEKLTALRKIQQPTPAEQIGTETLKKKITKLHAELAALKAANRRLQLQQQQEKQKRQNEKESNGQARLKPSPLQTAEEKVDNAPQSGSACSEMPKKSKTLTPSKDSQALSNPENLDVHNSASLKPQALAIRPCKAKATTRNCLPESVILNQNNKVTKTQAPQTKAKKREVPLEENNEWLQQMVTSMLKQNLEESIRENEKLSQLEVKATSCEIGENEHNTLPFRAIERPADEGANSSQPEIGPDVNYCDMLLDHLAETLFGS